MRRDDGSDPGGRADPDAGQVADIPVAAASVRWERPTARSFWNSLADPEREALAAAGVEEVFRPGVVLCRAGDDTSQVMIIDSGWVKVSIREGPEFAEKILAVRGQGDVVGERAALTTQVRSATVTALDEVSAMVVPAERFADFLRGHPRAAEVLERQVTERREEDRLRLFPGERAGAERRLAWLLLDLAQRRGGYQHTAFTLPMSQQELADWTGTSADAVSRFLRTWRDRGIVARSERSRRLTVIDLGGLAALCDAGPPEVRAGRGPNGTPVPAPEAAAPSQAAHPQAAQWQRDWREPLNCSILFTDVAGFSDPVRTDSDRDVVRTADVRDPAVRLRGVRGAVGGVLPGGPRRWRRHRGAADDLHSACGRPAGGRAGRRLRQYNRRASEVVRIQLRVALHVGPVGKDAEGLTGQAVISAARILDAPVIKAKLASEQADLAFAASDYVYDHVVRNCDGRVDPAAFEHMECQVKESHVSVWVHLAGRVVPPPPDLTLAPRWRPCRSRPPTSGPASRRRDRCRSRRRWASSRPTCAAAMPSSVSSAGRCGPIPGGPAARS